MHTPVSREWLHDPKTCGHPAPLPLNTRAPLYARKKVDEREKTTLPINFQLCRPAHYVNRGFRLVNVVRLPFSVRSPHTVCRSNKDQSSSTEKCRKKKIENSPFPKCNVGSSLIFFSSYIYFYICEVLVYTPLFSFSTLRQSLYFTFVCEFYLRKSFFFARKITDMYI